MGNDEEVILLSYWPSPYGMRAKVALGEKGVSYEYIEEDLWNKSEMLLKMNPIHKKIPVLIHNNNPVCESLVIVQYIDEIWTHINPLMPSDPHQRARARFWAHYIDNKFYDSQMRLWTKKGEEQEMAKKEVIEHLKVFERELGDKPYLGGDEFGYLDVCFIPFCSWFGVYETLGNFKMEDYCPNIVEWSKKCMQRESVANAIPDQTKVSDFLVELQSKFGVV